MSTKKIFLSYAKADRAYLDAARRHLRPLERQGLISVWDDTQLLPGEAWDAAIRRELAATDLILFLVSADLLATDYIWDTEVQEAMARAARGEVAVVPVIIRPCGWEDAPFAKYTALPTKGKPIATWAHPDEAWAEVAGRIRGFINENRSNLNAPLLTTSSPASTQTADSKTIFEENIIVAEISKEERDRLTRQAFELIDDAYESAERKLSELKKLHNRALEGTSTTHLEKLLEACLAFHERTYIPYLDFEGCSKAELGRRLSWLLADIEQGRSNKRPQQYKSRLAARIANARFISELECRKAQLKEASIDMNPKMAYGDCPILMLTANPAGTTKMNLDKEHARIAEKLQGQPHRFALQVRRAVDAAAFKEQTEQVKPRILHFSGHGHGGEYGGIVLQNDDHSGAQLLSASALAGLFEYFAEEELGIKAVLLNACYSEAQAAAIAQHVPYVIGTTLAIADEAAIAFSIGFYFKLAQSGMDFEKAYRSGRAQATLAGGRKEDFVLFRHGQQVAV